MTWMTQKKQCQAEFIYSGLVFSIFSKKNNSINTYFTENMDMMETESGGEHQSQGTRGSDQGVQDGGDWEGGEHGEHADGQDVDSHKGGGGEGG